MCNKKCGVMTHQETTDRINALAYALGAMNDVPKSAMSSSAEKNPVNKAIDDIAKELSKLTSQD